MLLGVLVLPLLVLLVASKWGVLLAVGVAVIVALAMWVWRRGFLFIEVVAFLAHFDGLGAGPIRMARVVAAVVFAVLIYKLVVERWRPPAIPTRHWLPVFLLVLFAVFSGVWSDQVGRWFYNFGLLGIALALYAVTALMVDSHEKVMRYLRAFWVGGLFGSGAGVLALFLGTRSVGFGGDPNVFGLMQAAMIPLTVYYRRNETDPTKRFLYSLAVLFVFAGAAGAGSRSGLIGAAVAIVGTMVTKPGISPSKRARTAVGAVVIAAIAFGVGFVANPNNLSRGFADRGAGRLDLWTGTISLIQDRPLLGHGFGQLQTKILPSLPTTPGVLELVDTRETVSSHNTFLDILGDLGLVGLGLWLAIFGVTILGFLRPRWRQTKQISMTMFVMTLPVISSSMFLPLMNNKVAWSLIGLSSALQVPSWGTRWRGFVSAGDVTGNGSNAPAEVGAGTRTAAPPAVIEHDPRPAAPPPTSDMNWTPVVLARWDVKVSRRFRFLLAAGAMTGLIVCSAAMSLVPTRWSASGDLFLIDMATSSGTDKVFIDRTGNQVLDSLVTSGAYAQELQRLADLPLTVPEIRDRVLVTRTGFGAYMQLSFIDTDRALVEQARPYILTALDNVVTESRQASLERVQDELRPVYPGEQRYDTSPLYLEVSDTTYLEAQPPKRAWAAFVGAITGALTALAFVLLAQRRPRVNNDDDLPAAIGMGVWTHVGHLGRRYAATPDQYAQVATMALEHTDPDAPGSRILVTTPKPDRAARGLAEGLAAALVAEGRRVVLVDAQIDSPLLSWRLGLPARRGLLQALDGAPLEPLLRRVGRWRLPSSVRTTLHGHGDRFRFLPLGRRPRGRQPVIRPQVLDRFGPDITVVVLAPSLTSDAAVGALLAWADSVVLTLVEGRTVTFDAEDAAAPIRTFAAGPAGVVMMDV